MKSYLYYVGILAMTLLLLSGPASLATPTNQTLLTDATIETEEVEEDVSIEEFVAVSIGEGSNATVQYFTFTPQTIEINAGETVTWFSPDEFTDIHTVTFVLDPSIQSDILLPFALPAGGVDTLNFELLPPFNLGEPVIIPTPEGREAIVAMNKIAWYPSVLDASNQTTYLEGTDIQATVNDTVKVLNSGIILPPMPTMETGQMDNTEPGTTGGEPTTTPEISPTSLTAETTNTTGTPTDALTVPDNQGVPPEQEDVTEVPLGPPFPPVSSFTVLFEEPGVYPYFCAIHPWMSGQVIVQGDTSTQSGTQPPANETAADTMSGTTIPDTDEDSLTSTPPSAGTEIPNPIFG
jgi:plastocyanin